MKILLSNDDGIYASGIVLMANRLAELGHEISVVAPDCERSGAGHSISTNSLQLDQGVFPGYLPQVRTFKCNGTPADCVMLGVEIATPDAELVLAGINSGPNLGCDVFYSGTVAAAREGYFENRRSVAVSLALDFSDKTGGKQHYETAVYAVEQIVANLELFFGENTTAALLNMNIPNRPISELEGFKMTFAGRRRYRNRIQSCKAPRDGLCYWVRGYPADDEELEGSDVKAVNDGFVALTFLRHDTTDYDLNASVDSHLLNKIKLK